MIRPNPYAASPACADFAPDAAVCAATARIAHPLYAPAEGIPGADAFALLNDPDLVASMLAGGPPGEKAFRRMVSISRPLLRRLAGRTLHAEEEIDEVLQDIYLAVHRALPGFAGRSKFTTWLYGLARHKLFDHLGRRIRRRREIPLNFAEAVVDAAPPPSADPASPWDCPPDEHFRRRTLRQLAERALATLPEDYRKVFVLREQQGLSGEEASQAMGCSPVAVRVKLHRARHMVADQVRQALDFTALRH